MIHEQLQSLAVPIGSIQMDPHNARLRTPKNLDALKASLTKYGQRKAIVVNKRANTIAAGNGTYEAALALGWDQIAAIFVDEDEKTTMGFAIADNRVGELSVWNDEELLAQLQEMDAGDVEDLGFTEEDIEELTRESEIEIPNFQPATLEEQGKLDQKQLHECPSCGHKF